MLLTEKLQLSEKLFLFEGIDIKLQRELRSVGAACYKELSACMSKQKKDTTHTDLENVAEELSHSVVLSLALLNNSSNDEATKKQGLHDFLNVLSDFTKSPAAKNLDATLTATLIEVYNNLNSLIGGTLDETAFESAKDELTRVNQITASIVTGTNGDTEMNESAIDNCQVIIGQALAIAEDDNTAMTDADIRKFIDAVNDLTKTLKDASLSVTDIQKTCREFKNEWAKIFNDTSSPVKAKNVTKISDSTDTDWEKEYNAAQGMQKNDVFKKFLSTVYGNSASKFSSIAPWLEEVCATFGFKAENNPILHFVNKMLLDNQIQIPAASFQAILNAFNSKFLSLDDFKLGNGNDAANLNLINCRELYGLKDTVIYDLLGRQHSLRIAQEHEIETKRHASVEPILTSAGLDADVTTVEGSVLLAAAILFTESDVLNCSSSFDLKIRDAGDIRTIVTILFGEKLANTSYTLGGSKSEAVALLNKMIPDLSDKKAKASATKILDQLYVWMFRLKVRFSYRNADGARYFNPKEMATLLHLDTKQLKAYKLATVAEATIDTVAEKARAKSIVDKIGITIGKLESLIPLMLTKIAEYKPLSDKEKSSGKVS